MEVRKASYIIASYIYIHAQHSLPLLSLIHIYGTNPGMGMGITQHIPTTEGMGEAARTSFMKSMSYMGFQPGEPLLGKKVDYVFLGACTNGRIEDFRAFASIVKGRRKAENVVAWLVPGSWMVDAQIREEGLDKICLLYTSGNRTNPYSTGHLKIFQFDTVVLRTVCPCR